jgi:hypothetical protein
MATNVRSRLLKYVIMMPTTNDVRPVNLSLMKAVLGMMPALNDVSRRDKMRDIYPLTIIHVQNIVILLRSGMIVDAVALHPMTLFLTALRLEKVALDARMDMLQMFFSSFCTCFKNIRSSLTIADSH